MGWIAQWAWHNTLSVGKRVALDTTRRVDLRVLLSHVWRSDMSTEYDILFCTQSSAWRGIGRCA